MSDIDQEPAAAAEYEASVQPSAPTSSGMGMRLVILLVIFVIAAGGILGYRTYLNSQLPEADPEHIKREAAPDDLPAGGGAALVAPGA